MVNGHTEAAETLVLVAQSGTGFTLGANTTASLTIAATGGTVLHNLDATAGYVEGSLRQGFLNLNAGVTTAVRTTSALSINLAGPLPLLTANNVTVENLGTGVTQLNGNSTFAIVENRGTGVTFRKLHFRLGFDPNLAGAVFNRGALTLDGCVLSENSAARGAALINFVGGGMPTVVMTGCTVRDNLVGAAIENSGGTITITSSTFSNNVAGNTVGGYVNGGGNTPTNP